MSPADKDSAATAAAAGRTTGRWCQYLTSMQGLPVSCSFLNWVSSSLSLPVLYLGYCDKPVSIFSISSCTVLFLLTLSRVSLSMPPSLAHLPSPPCSITPQVYAHVDSRLAPALSSRPGTPHACGRVLEGIEEQASHPAAPYPLAPVPRRPALPPLMWVRFRLLLPQASCMSPSYGEKSSPLLRTPTDRPTVLSPESSPTSHPALTVREWGPWDRPSGT